MSDASRFDWERHLREDETVIGNRLLVLLTLGTYMDNNGERARPAVTTLAAKTGLHPGTISRHLKAARSAGWLEQVSRGGRRGDGVAVTSLYRATVPSPTADLPQASAETPEEDLQEDRDHDLELGKPVADLPTPSQSQPRNESEVERAVEASLNRATGSLNRAPVPSQPRNESATIIPDHGLTTDRCVLTLACSKLNTPDQKQHDEAKVKVAALIATYGESEVTTQLDAIPGDCIPFGGELARILTARLKAAPRPPKCERCQDTGQTSTGYLCGCAASPNRRVS